MVACTVSICMYVRVRACVYVCPQGLSSEFMLRALSWRFETPSLTLTPQHQLPNTDHPTALRNALRQLSDLQVCMLAQLKLNGWKWAAGEGSSVGEAVVSALPALPRGLKLGVRDISLFTDESLGTQVTVLAFKPPTCRRAASHSLQTSH